VSGQRPQGSPRRRARGGARSLLALVAANVAYWPTIAPVVRSELRRWRERAGRIPDPRLRAIALGKLAAEASNAEVAATLATLAPRRRRRQVAAALVALEVLYDYLDGVIACAPSAALQTGLGLFAPLCAAAGTHARGGGPADGGYARELGGAVRRALEALPRAAAVASALAGAAERTAAGQVHAHRAAAHGLAELRAWAQAQPAAASLPWPELAAGAASSVLAMHALIAAAAEPRTTAGEAAAIDRAYLRIAAVSTLLDSVVDHARDLRTGRPAPIDWCGAREQLPARLRSLLAGALAGAGGLRRGPTHTVIAAGVVAYYTPGRGARDAGARRLISPLHRELRPLIRPTLALMRAWRLAKHARTALRRPDRQPTPARWEPSGSARGRAAQWRTGPWPRRSEMPIGSSMSPSRRAYAVSSCREEIPSFSIARAR
jgi:tetraprenyl-beta-curcumene synthase